MYMFRSETGKNFENLAIFHSILVSRSKCNKLFILNINQS